MGQGQGKFCSPSGKHWLRTLPGWQDPCHSFGILRADVVQILAQGKVDDQNGHSGMLKWPYRSCNTQGQFRSNPSAFMPLLQDPCRGSLDLALVKRMSIPPLLRRRAVQLHVHARPQAKPSRVRCLGTAATRSSRTPSSASKHLGRSTRFRLAEGKTEQKQNKKPWVNTPHPQ